MLQDLCINVAASYVYTGLNQVLARIKLSNGRLPANHDVERVAFEALRCAGRFVVASLHAQIEPNPTLVESIWKRWCFWLGRRRDGTADEPLFPSPLLTTPVPFARNWLKTLDMKLRENDALARLADGIDADLQTAAGTLQAEEVTRLANEAFLNWVHNECPYVPSDLSNNLASGFHIVPGDHQRIGFYAVWCLFFREHLKTDEPAFKGYLVTLLADLKTQVGTSNDINKLADGLATKLIDQLTERIPDKEYFEAKFENLKLVVIREGLLTRDHVSTAERSLKATIRSASRATSLSVRQHLDVRIQEALNAHFGSIGGAKTSLDAVTGELESSAHDSTRLLRLSRLAERSRDIDLVHYVSALQDIASNKLQDNILGYIRQYIDRMSARSGHLRRIHFTDSRLLQGAHAIEAWKRDQYLQELLKLSKVAARRSGRNSLVSRLFVIDSFTSLDQDEIFRIGVKQLLSDHIRNDIGIGLVSLRRLDELGCRYQNFCHFEGGLSMLLDTSCDAMFEVVKYTDSMEHAARHENLQKITNGSLRITKQDLPHFDHLIREQATTEVIGRDPMRQIRMVGTMNSSYSNRDVAHIWDDDEWWDERRELEWPFLSAWLRFHDVKSVIDVSCGAGMHAFWMAEQVPRVVAVDRSADLIARAQRRSLMMPRGSQPTFNTLEWCELPSRYSSVFDAAVCLGGSLIHADEFELDATVASIAATIRSNGLVLVDHRNREHVLREMLSPSDVFATQSRRVNLQGQVITFTISDRIGNQFEVSGVLHSIERLVEAFSRSGCSFESQVTDFGRATTEGHPPKWHSLTFRKS